MTSGEAGMTSGEAATFRLEPHSGDRTSGPTPLIVIGSGNESHTPPAAGSDSQVRPWDGRDGIALATRAVRDDNPHWRTQRIGLGGSVSLINDGARRLATAGPAQFRSFEARPLSSPGLSQRPQALGVPSKHSRRGRDKPDRDAGDMAAVQYDREPPQ